MTGSAADARPAGWHVGLVVACAALSFANTLGHQFAYDDVPIVAENPRVRSLDPAGIWLTDWWGAAPDSSAFVSPTRDRLYRPLTLFSFALNHAVAGLSTTALHATNVLLHALAAALVWLLGWRLLRDPSAALLGGLLFAVHPVHVEAVAGLVGRAEILATIFLAGGMIVLLGRAPLTLRHWLAASLCGLLGLLAKETAICFPLLFLLAALARDDQRGRVAATGWAARCGCLLLPLVIYFPLRYHALDGHLVRAGAIDPLFNPLAGPDVSLVTRLLGPLTILGHYARLTLLPLHLQADYGLATLDPAAGPGPMTLLGLVTAAALGWALLRGSCDARWRRAGLLAGLLLASYVLVSNSVMLIGVALAERLAYWPSALVCLVVARWLTRRVPGRLLPGVAVALLVTLTARTVTRNPVWHDNLALFGHDAPANPDNVQLQIGLADTLLRLAERAGADERAALVARADAALERGLRRTARTAKLLGLRGQAALLRGERETARQFLQQAIQLDPTNRAAQRLLGGLAASPGAVPLGELEAGVAARPDDPGALHALGARLVEIGQAPRARGLLERAASLRPDDPGLLRTLGDAYARSGQNEDALRMYQRVVGLNDGDWQAHLNVSALVAHRDRELAWRHAARAFELNPGDWRVRYNLAEGHVLFGRLDEARALLSAIAAEFPEGDPTRATIVERLTALGG